MLIRGHPGLDIERIYPHEACVFEALSVMVCGSLSHIVVVSKCFFLDFEMTYAHGSLRSIRRIAASRMQHLRRSAPSDGCSADDGEMYALRVPASRDPYTMHLILGYVI